MAVSSIGIAEPTAADKYLHAWERTISSVARQDQYTLPGQPAYPTYTAIANGISLATSSSHVLFIMADGTNYTRLLRATVTPTDDVPASASTATIQIVRLSTAGSSGTAVTVGAMDSADTYAGTVQTLPSSKGTEGALLWQGRLALPSALPVVIPPPFYEAHPHAKPIVFGTATTAGIAFKLVTGISSCTVDIVAEFITTSYL
jgi:hypothetical protein